MGLKEEIEEEITCDSNQKVLVLELSSTVIFNEKSKGSDVK